jgi:tetratricopeptide (TPR) repeat protein
MRLLVQLTVITILALAAGCAPSLHRTPHAPDVPAGRSDAPGTRTSLPSPNDLQTLFRAERFDELEQSLSALQRRYEEGAISDEDLRNAYRAFYPTDPQLEAKYSSWIEQFPKSYAAHLARAVYYRQVASEQRGGAFIDKTTDEQIQNMTSTLKKASQDVQVSLGLTSKPVLSLVQAIDFAGTLGVPDHGRTLLDRSTALDPNAFVARATYMSNLQTRWGGSLEEMQAFLEETRHSRLSKQHLDILASMVAEEQGWLHIHEDGDAEAALRDYERAKSLRPEMCLRCAKLEISELLTQQHKYQEAVALLTDVVDHNSSDLKALNMRAQTYMEAGMRAEAVADWRRSAETGNADAQVMVGSFYMNGVLGVLERDTHAGIEWFRKSAAQGNPYGKDNLKRAQEFVAAQSAKASRTN